MQRLGRESPFRKEKKTGISHLALELPVKTLSTNNAEEKNTIKLSMLASGGPVKLLLFSRKVGFCWLF
jgi:hypothetical protein